MQQFGDETSLIVTTLQKLNTAIHVRDSVCEDYGYAAGSSAWYLSLMNVTAASSEIRTNASENTFPEYKCSVLPARRFLRKTPLANTHGKRTTKDLFDMSAYTNTCHYRCDP